MDKDQFISRIANRIDAKPGVIEAAVDATLAELLTPAIFVSPELRKGLFDNNCNNNCAAEIAAKIPSRIGSA